MPDGSTERIYHPDPCREVYDGGTAIGRKLAPRARPGQRVRCNGPVRPLSGICERCGAKRLQPQPGPQTQFLSCAADWALYGGAAYGGKMIKLTERVPTPEGWTTIGEIEAGDRVFDEHGSITTVTHVHPIDLRPDSYRVTFTCGASVDVCGDHLWLTFDAGEMQALKRRSDEFRAKRRAKRLRRGNPSSDERREFMERHNRAIGEANRRPPPTGTVRTTKEILTTLRTKRGRFNHAIPIAGSLKLPERELPIHPYLLGAWLGDGTSSSGAITSADPEIIEHIKSLGYSVHKVPSQPLLYRIRGLTTELRRLGVKDNKHIPIEYLRAGHEQRLELLRGLMDTDGFVDKDGRTEFCTTRERLRDDFIQLVASLGFRLSECDGRAKCDGKDHGKKYRVRVMASEQIFRLSRKTARFKVRQREFRYICSVEPIEPVPMRCITVANPSGLFLVGERHLVTHNSYALLLDVLRYMDTPGWVGLMLRRHASDYSDASSIFEKARKLYAGIEGLKIREGAQRDIRFPSGATLVFRHLDDAKLQSYQGMEYAWIGIDEATHFEPEWIRMLDTRMRTDSGTKTRLRMTCNPDPDHPIADWVEPYLILDPNDPHYGWADREKSGQVRYWAYSPDDRVVWGETPEECAERSERSVLEVKSFAFIAASLDDNPIGLAANPRYVANLATAGRVNEQRLRFGNWKIREQVRGMLRYPGRWGGILEQPLAQIVKRVRGWDKAASAPTREYPDPDFTAGVLMEWDVHGRLYISGLELLRDDPPAVDKIMAAAASRDGPRVVQAIRQDPGQAGKVDLLHTSQVLRSSGRSGPISVQAEIGDKPTKAQPLALAIDQGLPNADPWQPVIYILNRDGWCERPYKDANTPMTTLLAMFEGQVGPFFNPAKSSKKDIVDAMATAYTAPDILAFDEIDEVERAALLS